jgi:putative sporulation protein YtaF
VNILSLLVIAVAVSLDSFGIGVAYGVRRIRVPLGSLAIITLCTAITLVLAVFMGEAMVRAIAPDLTEAIGGVMLMGIGLFAVVNQLRSQLNPTAEKFNSEKSKINSDEPSETDKPRHQQYCEKLEIIPKILKTPTAADFDHSNSISIDEAIFLGLAVSMDSFVAGLGIRLLGYSPWLIIATMSLMSSLFIYLGIRAGIAMSWHRWVKQLPYLPGTMLIVIGLHRLF